MSFTFSTTHQRTIAIQYHPKLNPSQPRGFFFQSWCYALLLSLLKLKPLLLECGFNHYKWAPHLYSPTTFLLNKQTCLQGVQIRLELQVSLKLLKIFKFNWLSVWTWLPRRVQYFRHIFCQVWNDNHANGMQTKPFQLYAYKKVYPPLYGYQKGSIKSDTTTQTAKQKLTWK